MPNKTAEILLVTPIVAFWLIELGMKDEVKEKFSAYQQLS